MMRRRRSWMLSSATALALVACGGGGDDTAPPPPGAYAASAALGHLLTTGGSWTMNGSGSNGQSFVVTIAFTPLPSGPFPIGGAISARDLETVTVVSAGQTSTGTLTYYFDPSSYAFAGFVADGICSVGTSNTALPAKASVGANGAIFNESDLDGCASNSVVLGTSANNWSIEADTGIVLLCWNLSSKDLAGTQNGTESTCFEIAVDGTLGTKARFAVSSAGVAISARNF